MRETQVLRESSTELEFEQRARNVEPDSIWLRWASEQQSHPRITRIVAKDRIRVQPKTSRIRHASRALVVHDRREILLMQIGKPDNSWKVWIAPGGGIAEGEDPAVGLQRELYEELGLRVEADFGPCVWTRRHVFEWEGEWIDQREAFYFLPVEKFEATAIHQPDALEKKYFRALRWWSLEEIRVSSDEFVPRKLMEHLDELLKMECLPDVPLEVGI